MKNDFRRNQIIGSQTKYDDDPNRKIELPRPVKNMNKTMMKACPWCGGYNLRMSFLRQVDCNDCGACGPLAKTPGESVAAWNTTIHWQAKFPNATLCQLHPAHPRNQTQAVEL